MDVGFVIRSRTMVQVNGPNFVRWHLPQITTCTTVPVPCLVLHTPSTTPTQSGTTPLSIVIDTGGILVSVENLGGTTFLAYYVRNVTGSWAFGNAYPLGVLYSSAFVTVDSANVFWMIGYAGGSMTLWSWNITVAPLQRGVPVGLSAGEQPSWITAERPNAGAGYGGGLIWVSTHVPGGGACPVQSLNGVDLWAFEPVNNCTFLFAGDGGDQVWPDTTSSLGQGVWVIQNNPGTGGDLLIYRPITSFSFPPCGRTTSVCTTPITSDFDPIVLQMDKNIVGNPPPGDKSVWSRPFAGGPGYSEYFQPGGCPRLGSCNAPISIPPMPPNIRGFGWSYAEYILTGTITGY